MDESQQITSNPLQQETEESTLDKDEQERRKRFTRELEFVLCLANPAYLGDLARKGLLQNGTFIRFLSYLSYFHSHPYVTLVHYPHALHNLELVQHKTFRDAITEDPESVVQFLTRKQIAHWATWMVPHQTNPTATETETISSSLVKQANGTAAESVTDSGKTPTAATTDANATRTVAPSHSPNGVS